MLLAIEIGPRFVSLVSSNQDPRLHVHLGRAESIHRACKHYGLDHPQLRNVPPMRIYTWRKPLDDRAAAR